MNRAELVFENIQKNHKPGWLARLPVVELEKVELQIQRFQKTQVLNFRF